MSKVIFRVTGMTCSGCERRLEKAAITLRVRGVIGLVAGGFMLLMGIHIIIEFTPVEEGTYTYSCWMGMLKNTITVVER